MKLVNETHLCTAELLKFLCLVCKGEGLDHAEYHVKVRYMRGPNSICGWAWNVRWKGLWRIDVCIRRRVIPGDLDGTYLRQFTQVFIHELGHTRGLKHKDMVVWEEIPVSFTEGVVITGLRYPQQLTGGALRRKYKALVVSLETWSRRMDNGWSDHRKAVQMTALRTKQLKTVLPRYQEEFSWCID